MPQALQEPAPLVLTSIRPETGIKRFRRMPPGSPVSSEHMEHTLLPKFLALPVFASDAISSVAYATQQIILALGEPASTVALQAGIHEEHADHRRSDRPLLAIVVFSYWQTIFAYPKGGGSYIVTKETSARCPVWSPRPRC